MNCFLLTKSRKFRDKVRSNIYRITLVMILIWLAIDVVVFIHYDDLVRKNTNQPFGEAAVVVAPLLEDYNLIANNKGFDFIRDSDSGFAIIIPKTYSSDELRRWRPAPIVPNVGRPGEMGRPVSIPEIEQAMIKETYKLNQFNLLASDMISLNRSLPDIRNRACKIKKYPLKLPKTSIVIIFHNEAWSTLLRTVRSVINRSPRSLLSEIILVDDASERDYLGRKLDNYVNQLPVRTLLTRIANDRTTVVCPTIDFISKDTFEYNWDLTFDWYNVPEREMKRRHNDKAAPIRSPTMAGGLFSIDRNFFYEIGSYDEGMEIWGAENLEMSFRIWMCGGTLEILPCSRVGHVFRESSPHSFPGGAGNIINHNAARLISVWLDEFADFFYTTHPDFRRALVGDVGTRKALRKRLKCKSFRWYLENIYPENHILLDYNSIGEIRNVGTQKCLDTMDRGVNKPIGIHHCHGSGGNQVFAYTKQHQIISNDKCLDAPWSWLRTGPVKLVKCRGMRGSQEWRYDDKKQTLKHVESGKCLTHRALDDSSTLSLRPCDHSREQQWLMSRK